ncbi:18812_t:CDS:2, partial [Racocetra persica]
LHIELSSESPNALIFGPNQLIRENEIFYQWASYLTEIKHEGRQAGIVAKHMLVSLWGDYIQMDEDQRVHTDGFILSGKISDQVIGKQAEELKIVNAEWTNFEEIIPTTSTKLKESTICYVTAMPNEIFEKIFQYHSMNGEKI